jgi:TetR/AcrR family tetracycline transcriptional repressor
MLAHRDGARLMATFAEPGPSAVEGWQRFTAILRRSGTTEQGAAIAADTIFCYVNGFTIEEQARSATPDPGRDHMFLAGLGIVIAGIRATVPEHSSTLPC